MRFFADAQKQSELSIFTTWRHLKNLKFKKKLKNYHFDHIFILYGWTGFFSENPLSTNLPTNRYLSACKVSEKSLEWKYHNFLWLTADRHFGYMPQLEVEEL